MKKNRQYRILHILSINQKFFCLINLFGSQRASGVFSNIAANYLADSFGSLWAFLCC